MIPASLSGVRMKNYCMGRTDFSPSRCKATGSIDLRSRGLNRPLTKSIKCPVCLKEEKAQSYRCRYGSKSCSIACDVVQPCMAQRTDYSPALLQPFSVVKRQRPNQLLKAACFPVPRKGNGYLAELHLLKTVQIIPQKHCSGSHNIETHVPGVYTAFSRYLPASISPPSESR